MYEMELFYHAYAFVIWKYHQIQSNIKKLPYEKT